ncbi:MAG: pyridoxal phosphate-dependent aminotransferase [Clostridiales Family XIII bacterium]|jgi:aspartate aminotransferase|nr:pyridoxal phosphate-dependent aminotransferase [Clostridiales Family XIII bacterium]
MISKKMIALVEGSGAIRAMFEEGNRLAALYGRENVFDFSLGNPNFPAPEAVKQAISDIINNEDPVTVHGYMSNAGYADVRESIAASLNSRFGTSFGLNNIIMSVGAAGGLNVVLKTLLNPGDEVIVFAPYFVEYGNYVGTFDGKLVVVPPDTSDFLPKPEALEAAISPRTKVIILNSPNNPTGVVYSAETIRRIAEVLEKGQQTHGTSIYIISDEPYRELAYDGVDVPYLTGFYENTIVCYSWSKSLSLPGERIGYIVIPDAAYEYQLLFDAACIATRMLGFVNAPSLMQRAAAKCLDAKTDIQSYDRNRKRLYGWLTDCGFECVFPQGAFYLWMKSPVPEPEFIEAAKRHNILLVPGGAFGCPGYVRLAYCVSPDTIEHSLPAFKKLAAEYPKIDHS